MHQGRKVIVWFNDVTKEDIPLVGGKGANLGEMTRANIPVPPGFIVTSTAYFDFLREAKLTDKIRSLLEPLNPDDSKKLQQVATEIKQVITDATIPLDIVEQIKEAYSKMGGGLVAVRSSATAEDLPEASFAGQQSTFLNVRGEENVIIAVQGCWASLFEPRAIFYRQQQDFDHLKVRLAVPVQKMVESEASGVMFTIEPVTSDTNKVVIEAVFGLGEAIVGGEVTPDLYIVDKERLKISTRKIGKQAWKLSRNPAADAKEPNIQVPLAPLEQTQQKLGDEDIFELVKLGKRLEVHYQFPQDIEWAKEGDRLFIVQTRPVTTIKEGAEAESEISAPVLLTGDSASPGTASGPVRVIHEASEIYRVEDGDILVAEMTTPDFVPAMKRAVAIVTERGGRTAHAAIVSRELGIPCVVGTEGAMTVLTERQVITVDGSRGKIYEGKLTRRLKTAPVTSFIREAVKTKTKVYVNLAQPELAEIVAARNVDGIGLLRAEFIVARIGEHPRYMIEQNRGHEFVEKLYQGINTFAKAFDPRPVVYRTTDFKTNEYRDLKGGKRYEDVEENPMLGYRGASRYIAEPDIFDLEIEAIKRVREEHKNLWVMIPFVRTVDGMARIKSHMEFRDLRSSEDFKLWMMVEVPSNIFLIEKFIEVGLDGISIGTNDLTQLILGIDRDSSRLKYLFDE